MAEKKNQDSRVQAGGASWGPGEGQAAADAYPAFPGQSADSKDYVLVEKIHPEADGLRLQEQVLKSDLEESEDYKDLSLESDNVREAHPAANRPTSDLNEEEVDAEGRKRA